MREIKFRGKSLDNRKWVFGDYARFDNDVLIPEGGPLLGLMPKKAHYIIVQSSDTIEVDPDTIGQFTGINDINNNPIYEGDLVGVMIAYTPVIFQVIYDNGAFCLADKDGLVWYGLDDMKCEVAGNLWDNPELLED